MAEVSGEPGATGGQQPAARDRKRDARLVAAGVVVVLVVWFAIANLRDVPVRFWVVEGRYPMIAVVLISFLLGVALTLLATRLKRRRQSQSDDVPAD